jgi:hypothetical protein
LIGGDCETPSGPGSACRVGAQTSPGMMVMCGDSWRRLGVGGGGTMTKRDELAAWLADLPDAAVDALHAEAARLRVTMAPAGPELDQESRAWLDESAANLLATLDELEADIPADERERWLSAMMAGAVAVRFDPATGEVIEVSA